MIWPKKKPPLLPKTLAARAEKVPAEKVEAEVLRIIKAPAAPAGLAEIRGLAFAPIPVPPWPPLYQQAQAIGAAQGMLQSSIFGQF